MTVKNQEIKTMIKSFKRQIVLLLYGKGIYYINGSDNLPPLLSAELEEEYARLTSVSYTHLTLPTT